MKLHYRDLGQGTPFVILHGLFGLSDNWQTLAKYWSQKYHVYLLDLRNHGRSPHSTDFNHDLMVEDLAEFITDHQLVNPVVMGHSMGGKAAMNFALSYPEKVNKLIVVDIAPRPYPVHHQDIINGLNAINISTMTSRSEAEAALLPYIPEADTRLFLLKNLYRKEDNTFGWRMNLASIEQNIEEIGREITAEVPFTKPTLFIKGGNSRYIQEKDYPAIQRLFPQSQIVAVENAGHWVHAEAPEKFYQLVVDFIR
ncbi:alpha/beta fold hydrolase [Adhaeribacter radiodurans]|uniref:Alpha/beta fold hydrolase n=1 Tax=Adhaeribacter radiodurans TaxID=2745197 RepID=A0A7L7L3U7_9BACT|nr:alpha/beta fold hydrolase [Adhaeribacter radiodurans]QMU27039.1 alpha/beta fold hydrolase [Adhaeribacter radiodurans]